MKEYKSLRTRIQYSIYMWTQTRMRIFGQNPRTNVDEIFGDPRLSGHYACSLDGLNRVDGMNDVTVARHQTLHSHARACLAYISQSIASESDASHCAQRPPTTSVSHATTVCCQFNHRFIIGYGNSKIGYWIIRVSHPFWPILSQYLM